MQACFRGLSHSKNKNWLQSLLHHIENFRSSVFSSCHTHPLNTSCHNFWSNKAMKLGSWILKLHTLGIISMYRPKTLLLDLSQSHTFAVKCNCENWMILDVLRASRTVYLGNQMSHKLGECSFWKQTLCRFSCYRTRYKWMDSSDFRGTFASKYDIAITVFDRD